MRSRQPLKRLLEAVADSPSTVATGHLHAHLLRSGHLFTHHPHLAHLLATYPPPDARHLFDEIPHPTPRLSNALLRAHSRARQWRAALLLASRLPARPDAFTLPILLKSCAMLPAPAHGRAVHALAVRSCAASADAFVAAALVQMYAKNGDMESAANAYNAFEKPDVVLRTSVVTGYQQNGLAGRALEFFARNVVGEGVVPDPVTLVSVIAAAAQLGDVGHGRACHAFVVRNGFGYKLSLVNAILGFYVRVGNIMAARRLFEAMPDRDVVTWSCMIAGCAQSGSAAEALGVYRRMVEVGVEPNSVTVVSVLQACALACDVEEGRRTHEVAAKIGCELEATVATALVDMYMKCSRPDEAMSIFHRMPKKDAISWAAVIGGLTQNGLPDESLHVFKGMLLDGPPPDAVTMVKVLAACSESGVLHQAFCLHGYLVSSGFSNKVFVRAGLVDLYSKCGNLAGAVGVFKSTGEKDVVLWSAMIAGYGLHGLGHKGVAIFERMIASLVKPNSVAFVAVLSACSHSGLVKEGRRIFKSMDRVHGVTPNATHRGIMVDLLARAGELQEAMRIAQDMPGIVGLHAWCALLAGCRTHHNTEMSEVAASNLLKLDPDHVGYYNLLTNIYAFDEKWDSVKEVRDMIRDRGLKKVPGYSAVEVDNEVHKFIAGEKLHRDWEGICVLLRELAQKMRGEDCSFHVDDCLQGEDFAVV